MRKRGTLIQKTIIHIILVAIILSLLLVGVFGRGTKDDVKIELLEKQTVLLIEASPAGTILELNKRNLNGPISDVKISDNHIYIDVGGIISQDGYGFFSRHDVVVEEQETKFIIRIG